VVITVRQVAAALADLHWEYPQESWTGELLGLQYADSLSPVNILDTMALATS